MDLVDLITKVGLPTGLLFIVGVGLWKTGNWVAENVAKPIVTAHITFLDDIKKTMSMQAETGKKIEQGINGVSGQVKDVDGKIIILDTKVDRLLEKKNG